MSELDQKINEHFSGLVVRKDLVKIVKGNAIVPTYVLEYLLGQYCATSEEASIKTGIETVKEILRNKEFGFQDEDIISEAQISHIVGLNESLASGFLFHFTLEEELKKVDFETIKPRISQNRLQEDAVIRENVFKIRRGVERAYDINMRMVNLALVMYSYVKWLTSSSLNK